MENQMQTGKPKPPRPTNDDRGSLPLAMVVTVFCIVLSMLALSGLVLQATRARASEAADLSQAASDSGVAVAAQKMAAAKQGLCEIPYAAPDTFEPAPGDTKAGFRWWVDKTNIAQGHVRVIVESNSGNPTATEGTSASLGYQWDAESQRWRIDSRKGNETYPYPETGNYFRPTTPARFSSVPDNRGMGVTLTPSIANDLGNKHPDFNDAILTDGRYVWLAGEYVQANGANDTSSTSAIVKFDTQTGEVVPGFSVVFGTPATDYLNSMIFVGDDIVIGGKFQQVNGVWRSRIAKINKDTGAVISGFNEGTYVSTPYGPNFSIYALAYDEPNNRIYAGGTFTGWVRAGGTTTADKFAAIDGTTGLLVAPGVQGDPDFTQAVERLAVTPNGVVIAGGQLYDTGNALYRKLVTIAPNGTVTDTGMDVTRGGYTGILRDLAVDPDHPDQIVAGFGYASAGNEIATPEMVRMFRVSDGATLWTRPTGHDVHTVAWLDGLVYANVHNGTNFGDPTTRLFALNDSTGTQNMAFKPTFPVWDHVDNSNFWGASKIAVAEGGLVAFGAFNNVSGQSVSNFAWFPNNGGC